MDPSVMSKLTSGQREELMDQVKQQMMIANTQELLTVSDMCYWSNSCCTYSGTAVAP